MKLEKSRHMVSLFFLAREPIYQKPYFIIYIKCCSSGGGVGDL